MWFRMKINIIWNWKSGNLMKITFFFFVSTLRRCPLGKLMGLWVRQAMAAFSSSKTTKPKLGTLFWLSVRFLLWATPLLLMRTSTTWNNKEKSSNHNFNITKLIVFWRVFALRNQEFIESSWDSGWKLTSFKNISSNHKNLYFWQDLQKFVKTTIQKFVTFIDLTRFEITRQITI